MVLPDGSSVPPAACLAHACRLQRPVGPSFLQSLIILVFLAFTTFGLPVALGLTWFPQPTIGVATSPASVNRGEANRLSAVGALLQGAPWSFDLAARGPAYSAALDNFSFPHVDWPFRLVEAEQLRHGRLPLWNAYSSLGIPLAAQYETQLFFPLEWLAILTGPRSWGFLLAATVYLAGMGAYLYMRGIVGDGWSALACAVSYMFSPYFLWFYPIAAFVNGAMLIPWLLWSVQQAFDKPRLGTRQAGIVALAVGLVLLSGQPQMSVLTLLATGLYAVVITVLRLPAWAVLARAVSVGLAAILGLGIAALMVRLFQEALQSGYTLHPPGAYAGARTSILNFILPLWPFLMGQLMNGWSPHTPISSLNWEAFPLILGAGGALGIALAVTAFPRPWASSDRPAPAHLWSMLALAGLIFTIIGLGSLGETGVWSLPYLNQVNLPRYGAPFVAMIFAVLIGWGCRNVARLTVRRWIVANIIVLVLAGCTLSLALPFILAPPPETDWAYYGSSLWLGFVPFVTVYVVGNLVLAARVLQRTTNERAQAALVVVLVAQSLAFMRYGFSLADELSRLWILILVATSALLVTFGRWRSFTVANLLAVLATGSLLLGAPMGLRTERDPFSTTPAVVRFLQERVGEGSHHGRVVATRSLINPNILAAYGIADLTSAHPVQVATTAEFLLNVLTERKLRYTVPTGWIALEDDDDNLGWVDYRARRKFFNFLGVRYLLDRPNGALAIGPLPGLSEIYNDGDIVVYEESMAAPRAFAVSAATTTLNAQAAAARILEPGFDPRTTAVVEDPSGTFPSTSLPGITETSRTVTIRSYAHDVVEVQVGDGDLALIVMTDAYYPGWHAYIDNEPQEMYRVNSAVRGAVVGPGMHTLTVRYEPDYLGELALISLLSTWIAIAMLLPGSPADPTAPSNALRGFRPTLGMTTVRCAVFVAGCIVIISAVAGTLGLPLIRQVW